MLEELDDAAVPAAVECEQAALGLCLHYPELAVKLVSQVNEEEWYDSRHRAIFKAMSDLVNKPSPCGYEVVVQRLKQTKRIEAAGGWHYVSLLALDAYTMPCLLDGYIREIQECARQRCLALLPARIAVKLSEGLTAAQMAAYIREQTDVAVTPPTEISATRADALVQRLVDDLAERKGSTGLKGLATSFDKLDGVLGGLHPGNLILVAARPGGGKSAFAGNIAHRLAISGKSVLVFSLEMTDMEVMERIVCAQAQIDSQRMRNAVLTAADEYHLTETQETFKDTLLHIYGSSSDVRTVLQMEAVIADLAHNNIHPDLIIVDYIQLLAGSTKTDNRTLEVGSISRDLKKLAGRLGIPVVALSQLNRETVKRDRPILTDLRESGSLEQDADIVLFIHRTDNSETHDAEVIIGKNRHGALQTIPMYFKPEMTSFIEVA